jgi:2-aminoethylphosphonate-pyruvate transaminase
MENSYLLLTPGPLSTSPRVRRAMELDLCTWDGEYLELVQDIRSKLIHLATDQTGNYTSVLMQGSGTFGVESVIGSVIPKDSGKLLIATNGAYGNRIIEMAKILDIPHVTCRSAENQPVNQGEVEELLKKDPSITHVILVHCETTTGILNPAKAICETAKIYGKITIVDAMSSFGGIEMDVDSWKIDYLISSANKCIQGVPGFSFIIANTEELQMCKGNGRSLSLDLYDQWKTMELKEGKWRYTSPTHTVRAFNEALKELQEEGGVSARNERYSENQRYLVEGLEKAGFEAYIERKHQSPIITSFLYPGHDFSFSQFYENLKEKGFVIYPGKVSDIDTFRIGNIGDVNVNDMERLVSAIQEYQLKEGAVIS